MYTWENRKWSKPPTRNWFVILSHAEILSADDVQRPPRARDPKSPAVGAWSLALACNRSWGAPKRKQRWTPFQRNMRGFLTWWIPFGYPWFLHILHRNSLGCSMIFQFHWNKPFAAFGVPPWLRKHIWKKEQNTSANHPPQYDRFAHPNGVLAEPARETVIKVTEGSNECISWALEIIQFPHVVFEELLVSASKHTFMTHDGFKLL